MITVCGGRARNPLRIADGQARQAAPALVDELVGLQQQPVGEGDGQRLGALQVYPLPNYFGGESFQALLVAFCVVGVKQESPALHVALIL